jgi:hypothetical protein
MFFASVETFLRKKVFAYRPIVRAAAIIPKIGADVFMKMNLRDTSYMQLDH